jgi:hypothetical protein
MSTWRQILVGNAFRLHPDRNYYRDLAQYVLFVVICIGLCPAQSASSDQSVHKITVRFLNGKTGKPIKDDVPNFWFGDTIGAMNYPTNSKGEVILRATGTDKEIRVLPNLYADCRFKSDTPTGRLIEYSVQEIDAHGIVSDNVCGTHHISPIPGVLVIYVRPRTFMEKWRL